MDGKRPFSWTRASHLIKHWIDGTTTECHPLLLIPAALLSSFFGSSSTAIVFTPTIYLLLLLLFSYFCGKEINGKAAGFSVALFIGMIPWVIGLSRYGRAYICLFAACALTYYLLLKTDNFSRLIYSMLFVASFKISFYVAPSKTAFLLFLLSMSGPCLVHAILGLARRKNRILKVIILVAISAIFIHFLKEWNMLDFLNNRLHEYRRDELEQLFFGDILHNPMAALAYPVHLIMVQVSPVIILCGAYPILKFFRKSSSKHHSSIRIDLALMFLLPLVILSYYNKKQAVYIHLLCLPLGIMAGVGMSYMWKKKKLIIFLLVIAVTCLIWRSIPISEVFHFRLPFQYRVVRAVDWILWSGSCQVGDPFGAFFNKRIICYPSQHTSRIDASNLDKAPYKFFKDMSNLCGLRIGMMHYETGFTSWGDIIRKEAEMLALNPINTVHLFNGMRTFDLTLEDLDWFVVRPREGVEFERWLEEMNDHNDLPWDMFGCHLCFNDDNRSVWNFQQFMADLKEKADLKFIMEHHFFFSIPSD